MTAAQAIGIPCPDPSPEGAQQSGFHSAPAAPETPRDLRAPVPPRTAWSAPAPRPADELRDIFRNHAKQPFRMLSEPLPGNPAALREAHERHRQDLTQDFPVDGMGHYHRIDIQDPLIQGMIRDARQRGLKLHFEAAGKRDEECPEWDSNRVTVEFSKDRDSGNYILTGRVSAG